MSGDASEEATTGTPMNGAESLLRTLVGCGIDVCFANPGTSEMHFVGALDRVPGMRAVLGLFEGVVTGAADGYARMAEKPAATLLHLGPGLANGLANLHNARKARVPLVNIIGNHATTHLRFDAPLTSDVAAFAHTVSHWVASSPSAKSVAADAARAVQAARAAPGPGRQPDPAGRHRLDAGGAAGSRLARPRSRRRVGARDHPIGDGAPLRPPRRPAPARRGPARPRAGGSRPARRCDRRAPPVRHVHAAHRARRGTRLLSSASPIGRRPRWSSWPGCAA